jgi:hypothetical protein
LSRARALATSALVFVALELVWAMVTEGDGWSGAPVATAGFAFRLGLLGLVLTLRVRWLAQPAARWDGSRLLLVLLLLPALLQFQVAGGRLSGIDSIHYYVFLRSMVVDRDFELSNEYAHYGLLERADLSVPTRTGHRRSIYSVGPAVVWTPFFLAGELLGRIQAGLGRGSPDMSGYGSVHVNAVALGSMLLGCAALLLIHDLLRRHFSRGTALLATLLLWGATFFHYYLVFQPTSSHNASTCAAAYALWLWDRDRGRNGAAAQAYLGLILGVAMCIRWQNGVLLALPGLDLLWRAIRARALRPAIAEGGWLAAGVAVGAIPQMAAWKALYDMWVLPYPPQGTDFLRLDHPWILETLFSSRHGLLSWTPVLWAGFLGFIPLLRSRRSLALPLALPLLLMTYVNMCVGDWWAGASFSNRRFDSLLPIFACGIAAILDVGAGALRIRPWLAVAAPATALVLFNLLLPSQSSPGRASAPSFSRLAGGAAARLSEGVGFPTTWPASWLFAARHGVSPARYDRLVGRYLFYGQNPVGDRVGVARAEHEFLLGPGWDEAAGFLGRRARRARDCAVLFAPLDQPEDIELRVWAAAERPAEVVVKVNGREAGHARIGAGWEELAVAAPARLFRRELNDVALCSDGGGLHVAAVRFARVSPARGRS